MMFSGGKHSQQLQELAHMTMLPTLKPNKCKLILNHRYEGLATILKSNPTPKTSQQVPTEPRLE